MKIFRDKQTVFMTQNEALAILKTGVSVFLTGEPGSGKSHTVRQYVQYLHERSIDVAITASTGIAATHIGGMTIHAWSGIGIKNALTKSDVQRIKELPYYAKRIRKANVLIIDEISMLDGRILALVNRVCQEVRESMEPFGGLQVVFVGDFFQLPPIARHAKKNEDDLWSQISEEENHLEFAFQSEAWLALNPTICYLTEQHRQDDAVFLEVLTAIRTNRITDDHERHIVARVHEEQDIVLKNTPKLFSHNIDVDRVNEMALEKLPSKACAFAMALRGPKAMTDALKKGCLSPELLKLKEGATIMFTKNNPQGKFFNGTIGRVVAFDQESHFPIIETRSGVRITVEPTDWSMEEGGQVRARITQLPLRLAWAMTIHKSQGMSLDTAVMDLRQVFEFGQGYVALSRVRRFSGLFLLGYNQQSLRVHPIILAEDIFFRTQSDKESMLLEEMGDRELAQRQVDFIQRSGGKVVKQKKHEKINSDDHTISPLQKIRAKHPNAYRPWNIMEDKRLQNLFEEHLALTDIALTLGRQPGSIQARLIKLGLIEKE